MTHFKKFILSSALLLELFTSSFAQSVWTAANSGTPYELKSVIWTGSQWVAAGRGVYGTNPLGNVLTSPDAVTWTLHTGVNSFSYIRSVVWTGTQLVAVGDSAVTQTSPDGVTWTRRLVGTSRTLNSVAWSGTQLVAVGANVAGTASVILTSPDGVTWTTRTAGTNSTLYSVTWGNNKFVAEGAGGTIITSPDGVAWTGQNSRTTSVLYSVTWGNNQFVGIGAGGTVLTSPDAVTWSVRSSGTANSLFGATWIGNQYVAVGGGGTILTSLDGVIWTARVSGTTQTLNSAASTGSQLVAVGAAGVILTSPIDSVSIPVSPVLNTPAQNATGVSLSTALTWLASSGAISYRVQLSTDTTFTTTILDDSIVTGTSRFIGSLAYNTVYYWRVNAKNAAGTSSWSNARSFTTLVLAAPSTPVLNTPAQNATGIPITTTLTWVASTNADSYQVQLSMDSTFATTMVNDSTIAGTSRVIGPLADSTVYYWRVNAKNASGTSSWSSTWNFTTQLPKPQLISPLQNTQDVIPDTTTLSWSSPANPASYRIQVAIDSLFTLVLIDDSTLVTPFKAAGSLPEGITYYWRVNAKYPSGTSPWSDAWNFTTHRSRPELVSPTQNAQVATSGVTLKWLSFTGSTSYHVQVAIDSAFAFVVIDDSTLTGTSKITGILPVRTTYYWRVNATSAAGTSQWSSTWNFTTITGTATMPGKIPIRYLSHTNGDVLNFRLLQKAHVAVKIFNTKGRMISSLLNETREAGSYSVPLPNELRGSLYLLDFRAGDFRQTVKIHP